MTLSQQLPGCLSTPVAGSPRGALPLSPKSTGLLVCLLMVCLLSLVIAKLAGCIADTNYVTVKVRPLPTVNAGPDQTLIAGSTAQLNATGTLIYKYAWGNSASLSCDTSTTTPSLLSRSTLALPSGDSPPLRPATVSPRASEGRELSARRLWPA